MCYSFENMSNLKHIILVLNVQKVAYTVGDWEGYGVVRHEFEHLLDLLFMYVCQNNLVRA